MHYYLLYYEGSYYIVSNSNLSILEACLCQVAQPVASVQSKSQTLAIKCLVLKAIAHHNKKFQVSLTQNLSNKSSKSAGSLGTPVSL